MLDPSDVSDADPLIFPPGGCCPEPYQPPHPAQTYTMRNVLEAQRKGLSNFFVMVGIRRTTEAIRAIPGNQLWNNPFCFASFCSWASSVAADTGCNLESSGCISSFTACKHLNGSLLTF